MAATLAVATDVRTSRTSRASYPDPIAYTLRTGHDVKHVSPTVLREGGFRAFFFSREEARKHVHVHHADGEAKIWLEPRVEVAENHGLNARRLAAALRFVRRYENEIRAAWEKHFDR